MDLALLIARLLLAATFIVAGAAKLADPSGSRRAAAGFGVPDRLAPAVGYGLPIAELVIGVALIPTATARWAALGAFALLATFIVAIGLNLARGRTPDCHCFGQMHSTPVGWPTIVRNGGLAAIATFILVAGWNDSGASAVGWLGDLSGVETVLLLGGVLVLGAVAVLGWAVVNLMSQNGRLLTRLDALEAALVSGKPPLASTATANQGLPVGTPAPAFALPDLEGNSITFDSLRTPGVPLMLLFTDPGCGPCNQILRQLNRWRAVAGNRLDLAVISRGSREANLAKAREHGLDRLLLQPDPEVSQAYGAYGTPAAVIVRPDGTIGTPLTGGIEAIQALVASILAPDPQPDTPPAAPRAASLAFGDTVPSVALESLAGEQVDLAGASATGRLLLFWNPGCGFCQRMVSDLKIWEAQRSPGDPALVIVSAGGADATHAHGFTSTVLLDNGQGVARRFGAHGTPAAVRIDADGHVASPVASGATSVLGLLRTALPASSNGHRPG